MVIVGYAALGLLMFLFALTGNLASRSACAFGQGVANMVFVIPSQTLFQERTPPDLMGRVVGLRFALVFGSMTIAMLLGAILGQLVGPAPVIAVFGLVTMVAGLAGLLRPGGPRCVTGARSRATMARRLRYTGARAAPDDRGGRQE